eukprot:1345458-Amorphochlora_amoeboformis.AAC.1
MRELSSEALAVHVPIFSDLRVSAVFIGMVRLEEKEMPPGAYQACRPDDPMFSNLRDLYLALITLPLELPRNPTTNFLTLCLYRIVWCVCVSGELQ